MEKSKIKYIAIAVLIVVCGCFFMLTDNDHNPLRSEEVLSLETEAKETAQPEDSKCYIHIVGMVKKPGVYTFSSKPRIVDVVKKAGGFKKGADRTSVNLAEEVEDGVQIVIESKKKKKEQEEEMGTSSGSINLNTATKEELMTLSGIGESKADEIINYRQESHGFKKIEDVMNISGIKEGVFQKIKDHICV